MSSKYVMRKGFGLGQIMAVLLVVLPTLAFCVMFMLEYWAVMQADSRLKLIANLISTKVDALEDLSDTGLNAFGATSEWSTLQATTTQLCPGGTTLQFVSRQNALSGVVHVQIEYTYAGRYISQTLQSRMSTYSYHDQNATLNLACK